MINKDVGAFYVLLCDVCHVGGHQPKRVDHDVGHGVDHGVDHGMMGHGVDHGVDHDEDDEEEEVDGHDLVEGVVDDGHGLVGQEGYHAQSTTFSIASTSVSARVLDAIL